MESDPSRTPPRHVVAVKQVGRSRKRLIELSDGERIVVSSEAVRETGTIVGSPAGPAEIAALEEAQRRAAAHEAALRLLSTRARSRSEIRARLAMRGMDPETVEAELGRLVRAGLVDDVEFARAWVARRQISAPRGRRMLRYELLGRGIDPEEADRVTATIDDREAALDAARRKSRSWKRSDFNDFSARLGSFLQRRGFSFDVSAEVVRVTWRERQGEPPAL